MSHLQGPLIGLIVLELYINKHDERVKLEILSNAAFMILQKHFLLSI